MNSYIEKVSREVLPYAAWQCAGIQNQNPKTEYVQSLKQEDITAEYRKQIATITNYLPAASNLMWKILGPML